jgi:hypothetical protein
MDRCILSSIAFHARKRSSDGDAKSQSVLIPSVDCVTQWLVQYGPEYNVYNWEFVPSSIASEFKFKCRGGIVTTKSAVNDMIIRLQRISLYHNEFNFTIVRIRATTDDIHETSDCNLEFEDTLAVLGAQYGLQYTPDRFPDETDDDREWHIKLVNLDKVYENHGNRFLHEYGTGTRLGHPDSGFIDHYTLKGADIDKKSSLNLIDYKLNPSDDDDATSPDASHGLATCSVIIGMDIEDGSSTPIVKLRGIAPRTTYVPMRITSKILDITDTSPFLLSTGCENLIQAIDHAIDVNVDVISISMGTSSVTAWNNNLHAAIRRAVSNGIIVVCAAGNYTRAVSVYPAAYDETVSVAAVDFKRSPWIGSAWGSHVDVCAPGHGIYRAVVDASGHECITRGSGTSYACTTVAGIALLWLRHNINKIKQNGTKQDSINIQKSTHTIM